MVSSLISVSLALVLGPVAALVDARRDCERLSGDAGLAACTQAIRENPHDGSAYDLRGLRYYARGDLDSALADYTKRVELEPKNPDAYDRRGLLYQAKALREVSADPVIVKRLNDTGQIPNFGGPEEFHAAIEAQRARVGAAAKELGVVPTQ